MGPHRRSPFDKFVVVVGEDVAVPVDVRQDTVHIEDDLVEGVHHVSEQLFRRLVVVPVGSECTLGTVQGRTVPVFRQVFDGAVAHLSSVEQGRLHLDVGADEHAFITGQCFLGIFFLYLCGRLHVEPVAAGSGEGQAVEGECRDTPPEEGSMDGFHCFAVFDGEWNGRDRTVLRQPLRT